MPRKTRLRKPEEPIYEVEDGAGRRKKNDEGTKIAKETNTKDPAKRKPTDKPGPPKGRAKKMTGTFLLTLISMICQILLILIVICHIRTRMSPSSLLTAKTLASLYAKCGVFKPIAMKLHSSII